MRRTVVGQTPRRLRLLGATTALAGGLAAAVVALMPGAWYARKAVA